MSKTWIPHLRLAWGGVLGNPGLEIWSNSLNLDYQIDQPVAAPPTHVELTQAIPRAVTAIQTWFTSPGALISTAAYLQWVKLNLVGTDGKQVYPTTVETLLPGSGSTGAMPLGSPNGMFAPPWYQTYAVTLRTDLPRGRSHAGRIYPPMCGYGVNAETPYTDAGSAQSMATAAAHLIFQLNNGLFLDGANVRTFPNLRVAVLSAGDSDRPLKGPLSQEVTHTVVDRVPDIQRRRTNRVPRLEGPSVNVFSAQ